MGYIKKLKNNELVGGTDKITIYPVTSTEAVFEEITNGNESSFKSQKTINKEQQDTLDAHNGRVTYLENYAVKSVTINGGTKTYTVDNAGNVNLDVYTTESAEGQATLAEEVGDIRSIVGTKDSPASDTLVNRVGELETLVGGSGQGSVNTRIANTKAEILGDAAEDYNTLGKVEDKIQEEVARATAEETELSIYVHAIEGGNIRVKTSTPTNPDTGAPANTVYRVAGTTTYSDYMWNGTTMVKMAEYNVDTLESQFGYYKWETASNTIAITTRNQAAGSPIGSYTLMSGGSFKIKMTNKATGACTLNMNGTGVKTLLYNGDPVASNNTWENDEVISVYYDGTNYQASNSQGGSNRKIDAYLYGDLKTLVVGQTYSMNESVKTTDKQLLKMSKEVESMNLTDEVLINDLKTYGTGANASTYKALKSVVAYNGTETEGLYAIGKPSVVTITIDASGLDIEEDTDITVTIGSVTKTITVPSAASETKAADIAALIAAAFTSIDGWVLTDNDDGTLTLKCNTGGNNTISVSSNTGETGLSITSSAVNGNSTLNQYNNGSWVTVNLPAWSADTEMWDSLTENELRAYARQDTLSNTLNYDNVKDNKIEYYTLADVSWTTGKNINANSSSASFGNLGSVSWERASGKINCINATIIEVRIFTDNQSSRGLVFYDVNDTPLVGHVFKTQGSVVYSNAIYEVPNNAAYFRTTFTNDNNTFFARVTRNNPLGIYSEKSANSDAAISDADGNQVVKFVGGHVITKNFNSININDSIGFLNDRCGKNIYKRNQLYALDFSDISPIILGTWNVSNDGYISNGSTFGSNNILTINKFFAMTGNYMICDFTIAEGGKAYIGCGNTLCSVDFPNSLFSVYTENSSSTVSASENVTLDGYSNIKLRVILKCHVNWKVEAQLVNLKSGETIAVINSGTGRGRLKGNPKFYSTSAEMHIYDIRVATNLGENNNCWLYATGDSITEGYRMTESDNYVHRYAALFAEGLVKCSGNSGCKIDNVIARLKTEASIIKPVYTMVMIGTNGGNTDVNLTELINIILSYGSIPIINHIPANSNGTVPTAANNTIDAVVEKFRVAGVHILSCKMRMAVATDNDESKGEASALTIDGVHLNAQGHLAMFNRMKVDAPELFNF